MLLCLVQITGYQAVFSLFRAEAKSEIHKEIKNNQIDTSLVCRFNFYFKTSEVICRKLLSGKIKEFSFDGMMYDVLDIVTHDTHITVRCVADHKETALIWKFLRHDNDAVNPNNAIKNNILQLQKLLSNLYINQDDDENFEVYTNIYSKTELLKTWVLSGFLREILHPPVNIKYFTASTSLVS